jgi:DNA-binding NarL/FixJ family response regulator
MRVVVPNPPPDDRDLSDRELEVIALVVDGLSNQQIADRLVLSRRTVQGHIARAMRKTSTTTRTQLAVKALRTGLARLESTDD